MKRQLLAFLLLVTTLVMWLLLRTHRYYSTYLTHGGVTDEYGAISDDLWSDPYGVQTLERFHHQLTKLRVQIKSDDRETDEKGVLHGHRNIHEGTGDYFNVAGYPWIHTLAVYTPDTAGYDYNIEGITSVRVPDSLGDITSVSPPIRDLYPVHVDPASCDDIRETVRMPVVPSCQEAAGPEVTRTALPPDDPYTTARFRYLSRVHVHVVRDAVVSDIGLVSSRGVQLVPLSCLNVPDPPAARALPGAPLYDEVLVATQFWSYGYYHWSVEALPRLVPFLGFLAEHPGIKVHVPRPEARGFVQEFLPLVGVPATRMVYGVIRARVVYLPQGGACGIYGNPLLLQALANLYHRVLEPHTEVSKGGRLQYGSAREGAAQPTPSVNPSSLNPRRLVILIQRTKSRALMQHGVISAYLSDAARQRSLDLVVFSDQRLPRLEDSARLFHQAALLVGPHGAGLSNMMFCRRPAAILEVLCAGERRKFSYTVLAQTLGHRYYGVKATEGCHRGMWVDMGTVKRLIDYILDHDIQQL